MRIAVIYGAADARLARIQEVATTFSTSLQRYQHFVDLINCRTDKGKRLTGYQYVVIVSHSTSFFGGKLPGYVDVFLAQAGELTGKRSAAILVSAFQLSLTKALQRLMKCMEKWGMIVHYSEILSSHTRVPSLVDSLRHSLEKK